MAERIAGIKGRVMERLRGDEWQEAVGELGAGISRFAPLIVVGRKKETTVVKTEDFGLYHSGPETKVRPGLPARRVATGRGEGIRIETVVGGEGYRVWGAIEPGGKFIFGRMEKRRKDGEGYKRVREGQVLREIAGRLRTAPLPEKRSY